MKTPQEMRLNWKGLAVKKLKEQDYPNGSIIRIVGDLENIVEGAISVAIAERDEWVRGETRKLASLLEQTLSAARELRAVGVNVREGLEEELVAVKSETAALLAKLKEG